MLKQISKLKQPGIVLDKLKGVKPIVRFKSTLVMCGDANIIFLFGGFDEMDNLDSNVYLLDLNTMEWEVDDKHNGLYREGHLAVYIGDGNIFVFGGVPRDIFPESSSTSSGNDSTSYKDSALIMYNIFERKWIAPPNFALQNMPTSRSCHACCLSPDGARVYISGGSVESVPLDDLYYYDLTTGSWSEKMVFTSRFNHKIMISDNLLYSFGGLDKDMNHVTDRVAFFNITNFFSGEISSLKCNPTLGKNNEKTAKFGTFLDSMDPRTNHSLFEHNYINLKSIENLVLDICLSSSKTATNEMYISTFNLNTYERSFIFDSNLANEYYHKFTDMEIGNCVWRVAVVSPSGSLYLLGNENDDERTNNRIIMQNSGIQDTNDLLSTEENNEAEGTEEEAFEHESTTTLSVILKIDLLEFGLKGADTEAFNNGSISSSYIDNFRKFFTEQEFTDYEILTFKDEETKTLLEDTFELSQVEDLSLLSTVKVHKSILLARWPHFRRAVSSGMNESLSNKMFIPEPLNWVKGLLYYLYTNTIEFESSFIPPYSMEDYSGLLILSNLYELSGLRYLVLSVIFDFLNKSIASPERPLEWYFNSLINLWRNLYVANEELCLLKTTNLIKDYWESIINSNAFKNLPKDLIIKLCQECSNTVRYRSKRRKVQESNSNLNSGSHAGKSIGNDFIASINRARSPFLLECTPEKDNSLEVPKSFPSLQLLSSTGINNSQEMDKSK